MGGTLLWLLILGCAPETTGCEGSLCAVVGGEYVYREPTGWDGRSELPVVVAFHGHRGSPAVWTSRVLFMDMMNELGVLVVLPAGEGESWDFTNSPGGAVGRDERAFVNAVVDDVERRFPVRRDHIYALGQSIGGSMVYELACYDGERFAAHMPMAGTLWDPLPESCPGPATTIRHLHGTADTTFPLAGRSFGLTGQGDTREVMAMMVAQHGCTAEPETSTNALATCERWTGCAGDNWLELCLHDGGHPPPEGWVAFQQSFLEEQLAR